MKVLTALLIIMFSAMALFSFAGMISGGHHFEFGGCSASLLQQAMCPDGDSVLAASFHADAYQSFSTAVFSGISLILLALFSIALFLSRDVSEGSLFAALRYETEQVSSRFESARQLRRSLSRLERSPSR